MVAARFHTRQVVAAGAVLGLHAMLLYAALSARWTHPQDATPLTTLVFFRSPPAATEPARPPVRDTAAPARDTLAAPVPPPPQLPALLLPDISKSITLPPFGTSYICVETLEAEPRHCPRIGAMAQPTLTPPGAYTQIEEALRSRWAEDGAPPIAPVPQPAATAFEVCSWGMGLCWPSPYANFGIPWTSGAAQLGLRREFQLGRGLALATSAQTELLKSDFILRVAIAYRW